ncbi:MAG TPA: 50S ribosomal protein L29 [Kofleriaceae bacterium]|jgi:ribosomal protein L29
MSKVSVALEQLRDQPDHELRQALVRSRDELFRLHLAQHTNQVTSTAAVMEKRREIARISTILRARSLGSETQGQKTQSTQNTENTEKAKS